LIGSEGFLAWKTKKIYALFGRDESKVTRLEVNAGVRFEISFAKLAKLLFFFRQNGESFFGRNEILCIDNLINDKAKIQSSFIF